MANIVAIVGRPNVGKSTFFNRLIEKKQAIMDNQSGVTRDRHYGVGEWIGKKFTAIDTGGYVGDSKEIFEVAIRTQVKEAIEEASVILFVLDSHTGLTDLDREFAQILRDVKKPVIIVANKADNSNYSLDAMEFYELGMGEVYPISSQSGSGTGELLDEVVTHFHPEEEIEEEDIPKFSIVGRPNVGKSSFVNLLLGKERAIVTDIAGTTRDAINARYKAYGREFILTDTAGIRRKSRVTEDVEFYSVMRAIQAIQDSNVCILIIDATRGFESQDMHILNLALKYKKGMMIMINKWDLIEKDHKTADKFKKDLKEKLGGSFSFVPIIFTSVIKKQRVLQAIDIGIKIYENKTRKIPTSKLNDFMLKQIEAYPPPSIKGKYIRIKYVTQLPSTTPSIAFFCNLPQYIKEPYQRYLENRFREEFDFEGVPVNFFFRKK